MGWTFRSWLWILGWIATVGQDEWCSEVKGQRKVRKRGQGEERQGDGRQESVPVLRYNDGGKSYGGTIEWEYGRPVATSFSRFGGGKPYLEIARGVHQHDQWCQKGGGQEGDLHAAEGSQHETKSLCEIGAHATGPAEEALPNGCLQRTVETAAAGGATEIHCGDQGARGGHREAERYCQALGTGYLQRGGREHGVLRRCSRSAELVNFAGTDGGPRLGPKDCSTAEGKAGSIDECTENAREAPNDDCSIPDALWGTERKCYVTADALRRKEETESRRERWRNGGDDWRLPQRHGLMAKAVASCAQENRSQGRRQQWPCLDKTISGSLECTAVGTVCHNHEISNGDAKYFAAILAIFYYLQFVATMVVCGAQGIRYAIRMLLWFDSPRHDAAAIESFGWQILRIVLAFGTTLLTLICLQRGCRRRICRVQGRRISRKVKHRIQPKRTVWFFLILVLDGNLVQAYHDCPLGGSPEIYDENNASYEPGTRWDKQPVDAGVDISWVRPTQGMRQDQRDGSTILHHAGSGQWLRVENAAAVPWEISPSPIAVHGHSYAQGSQGVRRTEAVTLQAEVVEILSKQLWNDWCERAGCEVQIIEPQPPPTGRPEEVHYLITLDQFPAGVNVAIVDVFNEEYRQGRITACVYQGTEVSDVIRNAFRDDQCQPTGLPLCVVHHAGRDHRLHDDLRLPHATYVEAKKLNLEESFGDGYSPVGIYKIAQEIYALSQDHFTAEDFYLHHRVQTSHGTDSFVTTLRGQDILDRSALRKAMGGLDDGRLRGYVAEPQPPVIYREQGRGFWIMWTPWTTEDIDEAVSLQQISVQISATRSTGLWAQAPVPEFKIRYDPDAFDQEIDTVIDDAIFPIPRDVNEELDLPPRHLWRNYHEAWPIIMLARQEYQQQARLDTYGLRNYYLSNRIVHLREGGPQEIMRTVAMVWYDYAFDAHLNIYYISPQPPDTPPGTVSLIVEFPTHEWDYLVTRAVLIDTFEDGVPIDRRAAYVRHRGRAREVTEAAGIASRCWPNGIDDCSIFTRNQLHSMTEAIDVGHGDYMTINVVSFLHRYSTILGNFPEARDFARDFMWRSGHYSQNLFTLFIYGIYGQRRIAPITLERDTTTFRAVDVLWYDVLRLFTPLGATQRSILYQVWPQNIYEAERYAIHLALDMIPNPPYTPVLVTVVVQSGCLRPQRIETRAWQLPARITLLQFMTLVGYASFAREYADNAYVTHAGTQYRDGDTQWRLINGGNYELRLHIPTLTDFVAAVASRTHQMDTVPAEESESEQPEPQSEDEDMGLLQTSLRRVELEEEEREETNSLLQISSSYATFVIAGLAPFTEVFLATVTTVSASYTDVFLDRVGPVTPHGERMLLQDVDLHELRDRWRNVESRHGIPRPIDLASLIVYRQPDSGELRNEFRLDIARFDDPDQIPQEFELFWPDMVGKPWKLRQGHLAMRETRTEDSDGWHFILMVEDNFASTTIVGGWIEFVSRFQEDENSVLFPVAIPHHTTWEHLWNWLRLGVSYATGHIFTLQYNGCDYASASQVPALEHGFLVQIVAHALTEQDFRLIPVMRVRGWQRDLRLDKNTGTNMVFRAGRSHLESTMARLVESEQDAAILRQWPDLDVWSSHIAHWTCHGLGPPWNPTATVLVVHPRPMGYRLLSYVHCMMEEAHGTRPSSYTDTVHLNRSMWQWTAISNASVKSMNAMPFSMARLSSHRRHSTLKQEITSKSSSRNSAAQWDKAKSGHQVMTPWE